MAQWVLYWLFFKVTRKKMRVRYRLTLRHERVYMYDHDRRAYMIRHHFYYN